VRERGLSGGVPGAPADTYRLYAAEAERQRPQLLTASVYACLQCGHLEQFVDFS
jgi:hypothetical protein